METHLPDSHVLYDTVGRLHLEGKQSQAEIQIASGV